MARRKLHLVLISEDRDHLIGCSSSCPVCHPAPDRELKWTVSLSYYATVLSDRALGYRDWPGRRKGGREE